MITKQEYIARRQKLANILTQDAIAFIPATDEILRNGDAHYRFRQDSNFYYLTGCEEPQALLVIIGGKEAECHLFSRPPNALEERWRGKRLGPADVEPVLGISNAHALETLDSKLPDLVSGKSILYYSIGSMGRYPSYEKKILQALQLVKGKIRQGAIAPTTIQDLDPLIHEMRLIKSAAELALMRTAAAISVYGHQRAMQKCTSLQYEHQLEAELVYGFLQEGCRSVAYDSIVGAGANSCILHYTANNKPLQSGELVLLDAAGEYQNYAADITRTLPINGVYNKEQRAIYELVLTAQKAAIAAIKPGLAYNELQKIIINILTQGLCDLSLLAGDIKILVANEAYKHFYMHGSGHWLGLDVHDAGAYKINGQWRLLEPGMVLTVEPGLYISANTNGVASRWWNIGVRIEDDILVTEDGHENLTAALPVEVAEIEACMRG